MWLWQTETCLRNMISKYLNNDETPKVQCLQCIYWYVPDSIRDSFVLCPLLLSCCSRLSVQKDLRQSLEQHGWTTSCTYFALTRTGTMVSPVTVVLDVAVAGWTRVAVRLQLLVVWILIGSIVTSGLWITLILCMSGGRWNAWRYILWPYRTFSFCMSERSVLSLKDSQCGNQWSALRKGNSGFLFEDWVSWVFCELKIC